MAKRTAEQMLQHLNSTNQGHKISFALEILSAFGFETKGSSGKNTVFSREISGEEVRLELLVKDKSAHMPRDMQKAISEACGRVNNIKVTVNQEITSYKKAISLPDLPELRRFIEITPKIDEATQNLMEAQQLGLLEGYASTYTAALEDMENSYGITIQRVAADNKIIFTAKDCNKQVEIDYSELDAQDLISEINTFKQEVEEVLFSRISSLDQFLELGGKVLEETDASLKLEKPPGTPGKKVFDVEQISNGVLTKRAEDQINSACQSIIQSRTKRAETLAEQKEAPKPLTPETDGAVTISRSIERTTLTEKAREAKTRVFDLLTELSGFTNKSEFLDWTAKEFSIRREVAPQYFDPEKVDRPDNQNRNHLKDFRDRVVDFVREELKEQEKPEAETDKICNKLERDFKAIARERTRDTDLSVDPVAPTNNNIR